MANQQVKEKSWAEMMKNYHQSKFDLPWKPEEQEQVKFVSRYEMSRKEREFDPVLQTYRNPEHEVQATTSEANKRMVSLNKAKAKQVLQGQCFDIVNHEWKLNTMAKGSFKERVSMPETRVGYNIINNNPLNGKHQAEFDGRKDKTSNSPTTLVGKASEGGQFNIISNRYTDHHEERSNLDAKVARESAAKRFWSTHEFDPILCQYYDADREKEFQERTEQQRKEWKRRVDGNIKLMPPCIRESEGSYYDIVSIQPKDADRIKEYDLRIDTTNSARCMRTRVEHAQRRKMLKAKSRADARFVNRTTHESQLRTYGYQNGYNIVNHRPFQGRGAQPIPNIPQPLKPSLWQRMEQSGRESGSYRGDLAASRSQNSSSTSLYGNQLDK